MYFGDSVAGYIGTECAIGSDTVGQSRIYRIAVRLAVCSDRIKDVRPWGRARNRPRVKETAGANFGSVGCVFPSILQNLSQIPVPKQTKPPPKDNFIAIFYHR